MAFDADFLNSVMNNTEMTAEQKVEAIVAEHNSSERGLVQKRDQILAELKGLKDQLKGYEDEKKGYTAKITELEEQVKKNDPEASKKFYEAKLDALKKEFADKNAALEAENATLHGQKNEYLIEKAYAEAVKDMQFLDNLASGFRNLVLSQGFSVSNIDGKDLVINKDSKTMQEAVREFAATPTGKAYIKAGASGAGSGSNASGSGGGEKTMTQAEFQALNLKEPKAAMKFIQSGGRIV